MTKQMTIAEYHARVGTSFGASDWYLIDQARIDEFAKKHRRFSIHSYRHGTRQRHTIWNDNRAWFSDFVYVVRHVLRCSTKNDWIKNGRKLWV